MSDTSKIISLDTLQPANFTVIFDKIPNVEFHLRQVPIPNISLQSAELGFNDVVLKVPSELLTYDPFSILFVVDEKLGNWLEIFNWMNEFRNKNLDFEEMMTDATILLKDGDLKVIKEFRYESCFPITLSEITLSYNDETPEYLCSSVFQYDKFYEVT